VKKQEHGMQNEEPKDKNVLRLLATNYIFLATT